MNGEAEWTGPGQRVTAVEIDTARVAKLEALLRALLAWRHDPSNVMWRPVGDLLKELNDD